MVWQRTVTGQLHVSQHLLRQAWGCSRPAATPHLNLPRQCRQQPVLPPRSRRRQPRAQRNPAVTEYGPNLGSPIDLRPSTTRVKRQDSRSGRKVETRGPNTLSGFHPSPRGSFWLTAKRLPVGTLGHMKPKNAFLWKHGTLIPLPSLKGRRSQATAINQKGWIAGQADDENGSTHACLWQGDMPRSLGALGGSRHSYACDINDKGETVGSSTTTASSDATSHAFLWIDGQMYDVNDLLAAKHERLLTPHSADSSPHR